MECPCSGALASTYVVVLLGLPPSNFPLKRRVGDIPFWIVQVDHGRLERSREFLTVETFACVDHVYIKDVSVLIDLFAQRSGCGRLGYRE